MTQILENTIEGQTNGRDLSQFDGIVMLTSSDWHREPRSNRYHFAKRFARHLPVIFVQPDLNEQNYVLEKVEKVDITILHVGGVFSQDGAVFLDRTIKRLGFKHPLIWIYNCDFIDYIVRAQNQFKVYHATENYLCPDIEWLGIFDRQIANVRKVLGLADLVIAVSQGVANNIIQEGNYKGLCCVIGNGCDYQFFADVGRVQSDLEENTRPVVLYQGGINKRIDLHLLNKVIHKLDNFDFWFCGRVSSDIKDQWEFILDYSNVVYHGELNPEQLAELSHRADVGIMPFQSGRLIKESWPLKAFEYVACGLGVVTVVIDALHQFPNLFAFAANSDDFAQSIESMASMRHEERLLSERAEAAHLQSYDLRFSEAVRAIDRAVNASSRGDRRLNVLVLYEDRYNNIMTIKEHIQSFERYSKHKFFYAPATKDFNTEQSNSYSDAWGLDCYDVIIVHYAVRLCYDWYVKSALFEKLGQYDGMKILFIQDEYDATETARRWIELAKFSIVFTCVPPEGQEHVYPSSRFPGTEFLQVLTGYVPEDSSIEQYRLPLASRSLRIAYRGRELPPNYGELGHEKYRIGIDVRRLAEERDVPVDIEVSAEKRIYGTDWYRFLGSARATLGTESGSNIFDFSGELQELAKTLVGKPYEEVYPEHFAAHEGPVRMNQISPKIFEAIRLGTALILFEGTYSGVVLPDVHFIPLKKDYSNIDDVLAKLEDLDFLERMTQRAYEDVIVSGRYSYRSFVEGIDRHIDRRVFGAPRTEFILAPIARRARTSDTFEAVPYRAAWEYTLNTKLLGESFQRLQLTQLMEQEHAEAEKALELLKQQRAELARLTGLVEAERAELSQRLAEQAEAIPAFEGEAPAMFDEASEHLAEPTGADVVIVDAGDYADQEGATGPAHAGDPDAVVLVVEHPNDGPFSPGGRLTGFTKVVTRVVPPSVRGKLATSMRTALIHQETEGAAQGWGPRRAAWRLLPPAVRAQIVSRLRSLR